MLEVHQELLCPPVFGRFFLAEGPTETPRAEVVPLGQVKVALKGFAAGFDSCGNAPREG